MGKPWTGAEENRLRQAIEEGMGRVGLSQLLGRNRDTIRRKCHSLGIRYPAPAKYNYEERVYEPTPQALIRSSKQLREATQQLLESMSPSLRHEVLCPPQKPIHGTERIMKTCAVGRLAA